METSRSLPLCTVLLLHENFLIGERLHEFYENPILGGILLEFNSIRGK